MAEVQSLNMVTKLAADLQRCFKEMVKSQGEHGELWLHERDDDREFWLRMSYRAFFGMVEGWLSAFRRISLPEMIRHYGKPHLKDTAADEFDRLFKATEHLEWVLKENGDSDEAKRRMRLKPYFKACFRLEYMYFGSTKAEADAALHGENWAAFLQAIRIRDGLMHPQEPSDLELTMEAAKVLAQAHSLVYELIKKTGAEMLRQREEWQRNGGGKVE